MLNITIVKNWYSTERARLRKQRRHMATLGRDADQRMVPAFYLDVARQEGIVLALGAVLIEFKRNLKQDQDAEDHIVLDALLARSSELLASEGNIIPGEE